jgi:uncharacterized protein YheU (UPF0270 family)
MVIIPYQKLSSEALQNLIEEFVTRPGTDSGFMKTTLEKNAETVKHQLKQGDAVIVYDEDTQTANIVAKNELKMMGINLSK